MFERSIRRSILTALVIVAMAAAVHAEQVDNHTAPGKPAKDTQSKSMAMGQSAAMSASAGNVVTHSQENAKTGAEAGKDFVGPPALPATGQESAKKTQSTEEFIRVAEAQPVQNIDCESTITQVRPTWQQVLSLGMLGPEIRTHQSSSIPMPGGLQMLRSITDRNPDSALFITAGLMVYNANTSAPVVKSSVACKAGSDEFRSDFDAMSTNTLPVVITAKR